MKRVRLAMAVMLAAGTAAVAFEPAVQDVIDRHKAGKRLDVADIGTLMRESEQWCYLNQDHSCAWTDVYLEVTDTRAIFEIANPWDAEIDIALTDEGAFRDDRYICEAGNDWVPSVRATRRDGNGPLTGRLLWELKQTIAANRDTETQDCFDYIFRSADPDQQVVTLVQRQYTDDIYVDGADVEVTLHMNGEDAAGLTLRWSQPAVAE